MNNKDKPPTSNKQPVIRKLIPRTSEALAAIGLGTYSVFDSPVLQNKDGSMGQTLKIFVEQGGQIIDSSPMYGNAENVVGDLLQKLNLTKKIFYATKVWTRGIESGRRQISQSFKYFRTNTIDLFQIHNLLDWKTHLPTIEKLKDEGAIRYVGITHYHEGSYPELEKLIKTKLFDFVQLNYSILERKAANSVLPTAQFEGVGVIANRPFASGSSLFQMVKDKPVPEWATKIGCQEWAQLFLKYVISHPAVTVAIPATGNPVHMSQNMAAGTGSLLSDDEQKEFEKYFDHITAKK
ncbi:MAG: aldo/keto reductase [Burkholderiales bacterium]